ncbi:MAG TPA: hypothetical protein VKG26_15665 [Bacteroidia bacterium]|nr:hypothetical protein [Bacteroidia bacterium]
MKSKLLCVFFATILISKTPLKAQTRTKITEADKLALEGIFVEKYYEATKDDIKDTTGGVLPEGSVTYRIYVDLKEGYHLQAVYGVPKHEFFFKTTTTFFNNKNGGGQSADQILDRKLNDNTVALDSWVTIGVATKDRFGIPKTDDTDGSLIKRNTLDKADGLVIAGPTQKLLYYGLDLNFFSDTKGATYFHSNNGSLAVVGGGKGSTAANKVLIAQLTTNGKISFELNLQIGTPTGGTVQFVAKDPEGDEIQFKQLTHK